jgi:hypothetical protein
VLRKKLKKMKVLKVDAVENLFYREGHANVAVDFFSN